MCCNIFVGCVHQQTLSATTPHPSTSSAADSGTSSSVAANVQLPPLPEPEELHLSPPPDSGALIQPLHTGERAGFNGLLFNPQATAYLEVEYRAVQTRCMIDRRRETEEVTARLQAQMDRLQTSLDASNREHHIIVEGRDREITSLNHTITQQAHAATITPIQTVLYVAGGLFVGALVAGGTAYILRP